VDQFNIELDEIIAAFVADARAMYEKFAAANAAWGERLDASDLSESSKQALFASVDGKLGAALALVDNLGC
jgi:hypothetical protein